MPSQKDLKRLVRARMRKTGEAYTTARTRILTSNPRNASLSSGVESPATPPSPESFARLAGYTDEAVKKATGCDWAKWVCALDRHKAMDLPHRDIARLVGEKYKVGPWWAQMVTVGYERIKGLREVGQRRTGAYEVNKSKTIAVPIRELYQAFSTKSSRKRWLPDHEPTIRTSSKEKSIRCTWEDGTLVQAYFMAKGPTKSSVQVQHVGLPSREVADERRVFWGERLQALAALLMAASPRVVTPRRGGRPRGVG